MTDASSIYASDSRLSLQLSFGIGLQALAADSGLETVEHTHELHEGGCLHFFHDVAPVELYRHLAKPKLRGNLFVQQTCGDQLHDFALSRTQAVEPGA